MGRGGAWEHGPRLLPLFEFGQNLFERKRFKLDLLINENCEKCHFLKETFKMHYLLPFVVLHLEPTNRVSHTTHSGCLWMLQIVSLW